MFVYSGFCIEPGCGEKFYRKSHNQKYCEKHSAILASIKTKTERSECKICKAVFNKVNSQQRYCGQGCARKANKLKERAKKHKKIACVRCRVLFQKHHPLQKYCQACITERNVESEPIIKKGDTHIVCMDCKFSAPMKEATFGVYCTIGMWLKCRPLSVGAAPLEVRDETLDPTA